jgi:hypothetical protein
MKIRTLLVAAPALLVWGMLATGCAPKESQARVVPTSGAERAASQQQDIDRIKNNPHISEKGKAAALAARERSMKAAAAGQRR